MMKARLWLVAVLAAGCSLVLSCPSPISKAIVLHVKDELPPEINVIYPIDGSPYSQIVFVQGTVKDDAEDPGDGAGRVESLIYNVLGTSLIGVVGPAGDGSFSFNLSAENFSGDKTIVIMAEDWNGNHCECSILLVDGGNDIPSFSAVSGNGQAELSWDAVPFAVSYTVYSFRDGKDYTYTEAGTHVIDGLQNALIYDFQLRAQTSLGIDSWSGKLSVVPLSAATLAPRIFSGYLQNRLYWSEVEGVSDFRILRSAGSREGPFSLRATVTGTGFVDEDVDSDTDYYYRIVPYGSSAVESVAGWGRPSPFADSLVLWGGSQIGSWDYSIFIDFRDDVEMMYSIRNPISVTMNYLQALSLSNPAFPTEIWDVGSAYERAARGLALKGDYAYIPVTGQSDHCLAIVDISSEPTPGDWTTFAVPGKAGDSAWIIAIEGDYIYLACSDSTTSSYYLQILELDADPTNPTARGSCTLPDNSYGRIVIQDNTAFVGARTTFQSVDITNKDDPQPKGSVSLPDQIFTSFAVHNGFAYAGGKEDELVVLDISNPLAPAHVPDFDLTDPPVEHLACHGHYLFNHYKKDLYTYALESDGRATLVHSPYPLVNATMACTAVYPHGQYLYTSGKVYSFPHPDAFLEEGHCDNGSYTDIALYGDLAFVANGGTGVTVIDIGIPASISPGSSYSLDNFAQTCPCKEVAVQGKYVYAVGSIPGSCHGGLQIFRLYSPASLVPLGTWASSWYAYTVSVSGQYCYVGSNNLFSVIDVSDPDDPQRVGWCDVAVGSAMTPCALDVRGNIAAALGEDGLLLIDISDPSQPTHRGSYAFAQTFNDLDDVVLLDDLAFISAGSEVHIIDIGNPDSPSLLGSVSTVGSVQSQGLAVTDNYLFVATGSAGLQVIDIRDRDDIGINPVVIATYDSAGTASAVAVAGRYAYVADGSNGLQILDLMESE
jgi:hypothetical protein